MTQEERLDELIRELAEQPVSDALLEQQDAYLQERLRLITVTDADALPAAASDARLALWQGDITRLRVDAIVHAASPDLQGNTSPRHDSTGSRIHLYAGVQLRLFCAAQMEKIRAKLGETYTQPPGIPMMTGAYHLPAKKIMHVVVPVVMHAPAPEHTALLAACYRNTLMLCERHGLQSIAFAPLGAGSFPAGEAAACAVDTVTEYLDAHAGIRRVVFVTEQEEDLAVYRRLLKGE